MHNEAVGVAVGDCAGTVVVSPHADDAALSVGTLLASAALPGPVRLLTVFSTSGFSAAAVRGDPARVSARRQAEDRRFARLVGAQVEFLGFPDAPIRQPDASLADLFDPAAPTPPDLVARVRAAVGHRLDRPSATVLVGPCGIGDHIDHRVVTAALAELPVGLSLRYEDQPYATERGAAGCPACAGPGRPGGADRPWAQVRLTTEHLREKRRQLSCYPSQPAARRYAARLAELARQGVDVVLERLWRCA